MKNVVRVMNRAVTGISASLAVLIGLGVALLMVLVLANAIGRSVFNHPVTGTLEYVANWFMPLIVLGGLLVAERTNQHLEADILFDRMPSGMQREAQAITHLLAMGVGVGVAYFGWGEALSSYEIGRTAGIVAIPIWPFAFLVPLGFGLYAVEHALKLVTTFLPPSDETDPLEELVSSIQEASL